MVAVIDRPDSDNLVSVIIPVFNVRPYLAEALDSVLHQTFTNLEIIVIDDGSTDGSGKICDKYAEKDSRVLVIHQENKGLSTARNIGLDRMSGEAVVFLDPDDAYHPDYVKNMMEAMIREKVDLVICRYTLHYTIGKMKASNNGRLYPSIASGTYNRVSALRALADDKINMSVWNKLYAKKLWNEVRFLDGHVYESSEVTYKINDQCKRIYVLDTPLYLYRIRPGSITATLSWKTIKDRLLSRLFVDSFIKSHAPEIFTETHLKKYCQLRFDGMVVIYTQLSCIGGSDKRAFSEDLRNQIIELGSEIGTAHCGRHFKAAYWMILYCPWLLKIAYPVYRPVRFFIRKVVGR